MAEVEFIFNSQKYIIQCEKGELMKNVCQKLASKLGIDLNTIYFIYNGNTLDLELDFNKQASQKDKEINKMKILVYSNEDIKENKEKIKSKEIICPICGEICLLNIYDYNIHFIIVKIIIN